MKSLRSQKYSESIVPNKSQEIGQKSRKLLSFHYMFAWGNEQDGKLEMTFFSFNIIDS